MLKKAALRNLVVQQQLQRLGRGIGAAYRIRLANVLPNSANDPGTAVELDGRFATAFSSGSGSEVSTDNRPAQNAPQSSIAICSPGVVSCRVALVDY